MTSSTQAYTLTETLKGHAKLVICMAVTDDGKLLASGGGDGTIIWDLQKMSLMQRLSTFGVRGGTTALIWVRRDDTLEEGLIYGTHAGYLAFCRLNEQRVEEVACLQLNQPSEITSICYHPATHRLVTANRLGAVALFTIDPTTMKVVVDCWARFINECIPRSVAFNTKCDIVVFGLHDALYTLDSTKGDQMEDPATHGIRIGHVACDSNRNVYCVDTITSGAALYRISDNVRIQEFTVPRKQKQAFPKQVAFAEADKVIVSGSDHGAVYVFERRTGELLQVLRTGTNSWVQSITTTSIGGMATILAGQALPGEGDNMIFIFKRAGVREAATSWLGWVFSHLKLAAQVVIWLGAAIALYQNMPSAGRGRPESIRAGRTP